MKRWLAMLSAIAFMLIACSQNPTNETVEPDYLPADVLHNTLLCGDEFASAELRWIDDNQALQQLYQRWQQTDAELALPVVDFNNEQVLLITMGQQPTAGYRLNLLPQQAVALAENVLTVNVAWELPPADSLQAQVITHPCLLIRLAKVEFDSVQVVDQQGQLRLSG